MDKSSVNWGDFIPKGLWVSRFSSVVVSQESSAAGNQWMMGEINQE